MAAEHLCLRWNNFENNIANYLDILRSENDFVDVTITCGEKNFKAHKVILSACSPYFRAIFQENPCRHPVIILKNVNSNEMEALLQYIYTGESYIAKDDLPSFLNTANLLQIIGLINYNLHDSNETVQNGMTSGDKANNSIHYNKSFANNNYKPNLMVKKFANKIEEPVQVKKPTSPETIDHPKRPSSGSSIGEKPEDEKPTEDTPCPILSKQLLLPKKRKLSVDLNKNEFYDSSELSNSGGEDFKEDAVILRNFLKERSDNETEMEEEASYSNDASIKKEIIENGNVLEPEVDLCVKEENEFESASEESLHNGDTLMQQLRALQDAKTEDYRNGNEDDLVKVLKPDVSIFSKKLSLKGGGSNSSDGGGGGDEGCENLTLTPNVEIFLRNTNSGSDNLMRNLTKINFFKAKQLKKLKRPILLKGKASAGTSKCGLARESGNHVQNGAGNDKSLHLTNLPCPHCRQEYNTLSALKYHVRLMHSDLENKLFCHLCPMNFIEREYFKIHMWEAHNARF